MSARTRLAARARAWRAAAGRDWPDDPAWRAAYVWHYRAAHRVNRSDGPPPMWAWETSPDDRAVRYDGRGAAYRRRQLARRRRNRG